MNTSNKTNEMSRASGSGSCSGNGSVNLRKGCWTEEEDWLLKNYVEKFGEGNWKHIPAKAGLNRCRKSCRLRWLNYLRPNIKRGDFSVDEDDLIVRLHRLLGNRWSLIAGRIPGRTANDIKNHWNSCLRKKIASESKNTISSPDTHYADALPFNSGPSEGLKTEEDDDQDTAAFWRSLFLEGVLKETNKRLSIENKEKRVQDDDFS